MAKFYGIGVGPGDSELLTVKATKILKNLDVLYTPEAKENSKSLAMSIVYPYLKRNLNVKQRFFPMTKDQAIKEHCWKEIANEIIEDVKQGLEVGFITLGDPMVYSTYSYLLSIIQDEIETITIPGITSFLSIASEVQMPLVMDEESFAVIPATAGFERLKTAIEHNQTVVIMKVANHLKEILEILRNYDLLNNTVMVSHSSKSNQVIQRGVVNLSSEEKLSYFTTMIVKK